MHERLLAGVVVWLITAPFGCADIATIGGLCVGECAAAGTGSRDCDAGQCDAGARLDACAADGCSSDAGPVCREEPLELSRMRGDLMLVVDDSASLSPWWPALNEGLVQFLQSTEADGLAVGLQRFDEICEPEPHRVPLVPIAPLVGNRQALLQALPLEGTLSTSTIPALAGVLEYARDWAVANPAARVALVLLTDASPGACDGLAGDFDGEAQRLARAAYVGTPPIETYVIGFGTLAGPGPLALAGGTEPFPISVTPTPGEVVTALERVRGAVQPCAFRWPAGWTLASDTEVLVVSSDGTERRVPIRSSASQCAAQDGFYVADPAAAYPLVACETTCAELAATDRTTLLRACVEQ